MDGAGPATPLMSSMLRLGIGDSQVLAVATTHPLIAPALPEQREMLLEQFNSQSIGVSLYPKLRNTLAFFDFSTRRLEVSGG
jgi:hypothetical protein